MLAIAYGVVGDNYPAMGLQEGFGPGLFPVIIAGVVAVFAVLETVQNTLILRKIQKAPIESGVAAVAGPASGVDGHEFISSLVIVTAVVAAVLLMPVIGFVAASAGLLLVLSMVMGMRPLWKSVAISALVAGSLHLIFSKGFDVVFAF
ncbi:tripartite tricarboxylate transporter TctB family protein [Candidatus Uhrbacteria bacterium]|nr:tripartite tricarboxylate transporter TctB family protein [Candidatus Uhrbacteria bacterium]